MLQLELELTKCCSNCSRDILLTKYYSKNKLLIDASEPAENMPDLATKLTENLIRILVLIISIKLSKENGYPSLCFISSANETPDWLAKAEKSHTMTKLV